MITLKIDTSKFNRALRQISRYSGVSLERVTEYESGRVLQSAVRFTPAANAAKIRARHQTATHTRQNVGNGLKLYNLQWRYSDKVWAALEVKRKESLRRKLAARGLSKQSWERLAEEAGLEISVPAFVKKAVPTSGRTFPENAVANRMTVGGRFGIRFRNSQPTVARFLGGRSIIARAVNGRAKFFARNLQKGVFLDMAKIARAYPGMRVR